MKLLLVVLALMLPASAWAQADTKPMMGDWCKIGNSVSGHEGFHHGKLRQCLKRSQYGIFMTVTPTYFEQKETVEVGYVTTRCTFDKFEELERWWQVKAHCSGPQIEGEHVIYFNTQVDNGVRTLSMWESEK